MHLTLHIKLTTGVEVLQHSALFRVEWRALKIRLNGFLSALILVGVSYPLTNSSIQIKKNI